MPRGVIFDFYGTLAHWRDRNLSSYPAAFARHGYDLSEVALEAYFTQYDGVEHGEHSVSEVAYEAWVRGRLSRFATGCGVANADVASVVETLRSLDRSPMVAYPDAASTLRSVREQGWAVGVCSNWGWELDPFLDEVGLLHLVDSAITSARAGARKPHPSIYDMAASSLGLATHEAIFVGDTWGPDVDGPRRMGMPAVHVWRTGEHDGRQPPELPEGTYRIDELSELLPLLTRWE
jgi:putative hydrolase of the HAD superfamily